MATTRLVTASCIASSLLSGLAGCTDPEPEPYASLRIVIDTDISVPDDIDAFTLSVERKGVAFFEQSYDSSAIDTLPESLVLINEHPNNDSPEKQLTSVPVTSITVVGFLGSDARVSRTASLRFNRGQVQLALPLCESCMDVACDPGSTCKQGQCIDDFVGDPYALAAEGEEIDALTQCGPQAHTQERVR